MSPPKQHISKYYACITKNVKFLAHVKNFDRGVHQNSPDGVGVLRYMGTQSTHTKEKNKKLPGGTYRRKNKKIKSSTTPEQFFLKQTKVLRGI